MSKVKMTVGGAIEKEAARRFIDAWHCAEKGETFREPTWRSKAGMRSQAQGPEHTRARQGARPRLQQCPCGCPGPESRRASR
jgi:hypothetical protein